MREAVSYKNDAQEVDCAFQVRAKVHHLIVIRIRMKQPDHLNGEVPKAATRGKSARITRMGNMVTLRPGLLLQKDSALRPAADCLRRQH